MVYWIMFGGMLDNRYLKLKYYIMKNIKFIMLLGVFSFLLTGCEVDSHEVVNAYYVQPEAEMLYPNNPKTELPYTADELIALDHDPLKENFYTKNQNVVLKVRTNTKPESVSLINDSSDNKTAITDISEDSGAYIITLNTTVLNLGVEEGKARGIAFEITYLQENSRGLIVENITYIINRLLDPREFNSYTFFEGLVQTFNGAGEFATIDETGIDLSFRYTGDFTVSIWAKSTATNSDPSIISDKNWGSGSLPGFVFSYRGASDWKMNIGDGSNRVDISGPAMNDGNWHLLTVTFDRDGDAILYHDLEEIERKDMSAIGDINSGFPINIAQDGTGTYGIPYLGESGEAYIHDVAMSKEELLDFHQ